MVSSKLIIAVIRPSHRRRSDDPEESFKPIDVGTYFRQIGLHVCEMIVFDIVYGLFDTIQTLILKLVLEVSFSMCVISARIPNQIC